MSFVQRWVLKIAKLKTMIEKFICIGYLNLPDDVSGTNESNLISSHNSVAIWTQQLSG